MKSWKISLIFTLFISANLPAAQTYTMDDLKVLAQTGPYQEFFIHIYDIRPANRDKDWLELAQETSKKYVTHLHNNGLIDLDHWKTIRELSTQVYNKENSGLTLVRNKYGLALMDICFKSKSFTECYPLAMEIFGDQTDPQLAHDLGRSIHRYFEENKANSVELVNKVWPFYKIMAAHPLSEFYCDKDYFQEIVLYKLNSSIINKKEQDIQSTTYSLMHQDCWNKVAQDLKKQVTSEFKSGLVLKLLLATNSISNEELTTFNIVYLLQKAERGPLLEKSFQSLLKLKDNYEQRSDVLKSLKKLDPLPGKIFTRKNDKKALVLIKNLANFFPEYIDHYAKSCIEYLSGEKKFPNGNPTMECQEFFEISKKLEVVPDMVQKRYNQIRNFKNL